MEERTSARSKGTNRVEVPEARGALDRFKFEVANEIGVDLKEGYNGHLTTGVAALAKGLPIDEVIEKLSGIQCGFRGTSCPDQLSKALIAYKENN